MSPRITLAVAGLAALVLPLPAATPLGVVLSVTGLVALGYSVARPGSSAAAVLIAAAALAWLDTPPGHQHLARLAALALAIAVVHSSAALAAVVPAHADVPAALLLRWAAWAVTAATLGGGVTLATSLLQIRDATGLTDAALLAISLAGVAATISGLRHSRR